MKQRLVRTLHAAGRLGRAHALEAVALAGAAAVATGLWWIYPPVALIAAGGGAITFAFWAARCLQRLSWLEAQAKKEAR